MISFVCPTYNRLEMTIKSFEQILHDKRISEVIISDDRSTDYSYENLCQYFKDEPKVKVFQNETNQDCFRNKKTAIELATNEWCILGDSDNVFDISYLDNIFGYSWDEKTALMPSFAYPNFNYTAFEGVTFSKENIAQWIDYPMVETCLNCMNYFVNRDFYLKVWDGSINPHTSDSIWQNYNWLKNGGQIFVVPGLQYYHRVHPKSHYIQNLAKTPNGLHEHILNELRNMK